MLQINSIRILLVINKLPLYYIILNIHIYIYTRLY